MTNNSLWTACQVHEHAMKEFEEYQPYADSPIIQRVVPTKEQAEEYVECVRKLYRYMSCHYTKDIDRITTEEAAVLFKKENKFKKMAFDMRDTIFDKAGKKGLQRLLVKSLFLPCLMTSQKDIVILPRYIVKKEILGQYLLSRIGYLPYVN